MVEWVCATWQSGELTQYGLIIRGESLVACAAEGNEILLCCRTVHSMWNEVMDVQFQINVILCPAAAYHAPVVVALEYLHAQGAAGGTTLDRFVREMISPEEAKSTDLYVSVMHALVGTDHIRQMSLGEPLLDQCVSASPKEQRERRTIMHDEPVLLGFGPSLYKPVGINETGFPHFPARVTFGPADKVRLARPERHSSTISSQRESKVLLVRAGGFQVLKPLSSVRASKRPVLHIDQCFTARRHS
ncbi:hypothetical protein BHQ19_28615 [Mycolicibacterium porcinum]|nr:hypothetical protein BHQ19_28615 [Mycolicibacterium porcinum]